MADYLKSICGLAKNKVFPCGVCGETFYDPVPHLKVHMKDTLFTCSMPDCPKATERYERYIWHVKSTKGLHPFKYTCLLCHHSEDFLNLYMDHLQIHWEESPTLRMEHTLESMPMIGMINIPDGQSAFGAHCNPQSDQTKVTTELPTVAEVPDIALIRKEEGQVNLEEETPTIRMEQNMAANGVTPLVSLLNPPAGATSVLPEYNSSHTQASILPQASISATTNWRQPNHRYCCIVCSAIYYGLDVFFKHVVIHYEGAVYFCRVCLHTFSDYKRALKHYDGHNILTLRPYGVGFLCHMCGYSVTSSQQQKILDHFWKHEHDNEMTIKTNFKCRTVTSSLLTFFQSKVSFERGTSDCYGDFADAVSLFTHVKEHALTKVGGSDSTNDSTNDSSETTEDKMAFKPWHGRLDCTMCYERFARSNMFFKHVLLHFKGLVYFCRVCFNWFRDYNDALHHQSSHNLPTLPQYSISLICSLCGSVQTCGEYRKNIDHFLHYHFNQSNADQAVFKCRAVVDNLCYFVQREVEFQVDTETCQAEFADAQSLCDHVRQHLKAKEAKESSSAVYLAASQSLLKAQMKASGNIPYRLVLPKKTGGSFALNYLVDQNAATSSGTSTQSLGFLQSVSHASVSTVGSSQSESKPELQKIITVVPTHSHLQSLTNVPQVSSTQTSEGGVQVIPVFPVQPKVEGHLQPSANVTLNDNIQVSEVMVREIIPKAEDSLESEDHPQPSGPKKLVLEVQSNQQQGGASYVVKPAGKKVRIFTCRKCRKRFISEHFYRQHLEKAGH